MSQLCRVSGDTSERKKLKETKEELAKQKSEIEKKDLQIQRDTERLVQVVSLQNQQAELESELESAVVSHQQELGRQQNELQEHYGEELLRQLQKSEEKVRAALEAPPLETTSDAEEHKAFQEEMAEVSRAARRTQSRPKSSE